MVSPKDKTILIIEDEETILELFKFAIEREGFRTVTALNSFKALELVKVYRPALIILDMMLPGKSGLEVLKLLQTSGYVHIPIIITSGRMPHDTMDKISKFEVNVREFFRKPLDTDKLVEKIHSILGTEKEE